jgi:predicted nucleotidyltransferase
MIPLRSDITRKLLNYFFINTSENLYVNELVRKLNLDKRNLVKKAQELEKEGILRSRTRGNLKLYELNKEYPLYRELRKIFLKTLGVEEKIRAIIKSAAGVESAYLYGSYVRDKMGAHSDIDLLVIGHHRIVQLQPQLNRVQKEIDREINTVHISAADFRAKLKNKDPFILGVLKGKNIKLL